MSCLISHQMFHLWPLPCHDWTVTINSILYSLVDTDKMMEQFHCLQCTWQQYWCLLLPPHLGYYCDLWCCHMWHNNILSWENWHCYTLHTSPCPDLVLDIITQYWDVGDNDHCGHSDESGLSSSLLVHYWLMNCLWNQCHGTFNSYRN